MNTIFDDTSEFLRKFNLIDDVDKNTITKHARLRIEHLKEELEETIGAVEGGDLEEFIDGLIDLIYIASGTLNMCGVDAQRHWDEVHQANMNKERGVNPKRGHNVDVVKPEGWVEPNHTKLLEE